MKKRSLHGETETRREEVAKPPYERPEVVVSHSEQELDEQFSTLVGQTHVDVFPP